MERTYVMLKPDAYERKLVGKIITRIEEKGFHITAIKIMTLNEEILKEHYCQYVNESFFSDIVNFMTSGPVVGMIVEGEDVIQGIRNLAGPTKWLQAPPGSIRGDFANNTTRNLIHSADSVENAELEIKRFFG
jgi:nucleoside-diphosphate kinase